MIQFNDVKFYYERILLDVTIVFFFFFFSQLLECLFVLLSSPATVNHFGLFVAIRDFFHQLLDTQRGLLFLCARPDTTNGILRVLTQMGVRIYIFKKMVYIVNVITQVKQLLIIVFFMKLFLIIFYIQGSF